MGALDIFTPQGKYAGERPAFVPKDFSDVAGAAFTNTRQNFNTDAEIRLIGDPLNERNSMVKTRLGRDVFELTGMNEKYPNPSPEGQAQKLEEANKDIDELIMRGRKEFPTIYEGIKTTAEIVEEGKGVAQQATINYEDVASRNLSDVSRIAGSLTGGIGGAFTDPINILTLPLGAGAVKPIGAGALGYAKGVVMQAGKEGFIQAGIEAASIPQIAKWQNEVGHTYGLGEAATDVAFGFLGGAGIRGGAEAIVPSLRGLRRGGAKVSSYVLDRIASKSPDMPQTVKDSLKYMSRTAYIDEDAPTPIRARDELQSHREAFEKVSSDVEKYDVPTVATKAGEPPLADTRVDIEKLDMSDPFTIASIIQIIRYQQSARCENRDWLYTGKPDAVYQEEWRNCRQWRGSGQRRN